MADDDASATCSRLTAAEIQLLVHPEAAIADVAGDCDRVIDSMRFPARK